MTSGDPQLIGTAYVATSDYHPLEIDTNLGTVIYETYEYLPATTANLKLLDLAAQHPGATISNDTPPTNTSSTSTNTTASPATP